MKFEYRITLGYLIIGFFWILFSDNLLHFLIDDNKTLTEFQTYKGWFYVIVTAILFFLILKRYLEKKRSIDKAMKVNERKLDAILNHHYQLTGLIGITGELLVANQMALNFASVEEKDVIGKLFWDCPWWKSEQRDEVISAFNRAKNGEFVRFKTYHTTPKGIKRFFDFSFNPVRNDNNKIVYIVPEGRDITEIQVLEDTLRESKERFRSIFSLATDGIILHSPSLETGIIDTNESAYKILGYETKQDLIGKTIFDISPEFQANNVKSAEIGRVYIEECLKNGKTQFEWIHVKKDKSDIYIDVVLTKIIINGEICIHSTWRDISQRKRVEFELYKAKEDAIETGQKLINYQSIAKLGGWELDIETGVFTFNDNFYQIFHTTADKVGGYKLTTEQYAKQFVHPEEVNFVTEHLEKIVNTEDPNYTNYIEHRIQYTDGGIGYIGVRYFIVKNSKGKTTKAFGVIQDISEKKNYEIEIINAKEKAEESNKLKTAFLLNISHEIRTPMNGILGFLELMNEPDLTSKELSTYLKIMNQSSERLMNTINDLIDISKIESGNVTLDSDEINISEIMHFHMDRFEAECKNKEVALVLKEQITGQKALLFADKKKLNNILVNLIRNAIKFTQHGNIEIGNYLKGDHAYFYVSDTGRGIPNEKLDDIYNYFVQADHSLSRGYEGTGIGLSLVRAYVEIMKGSIEVKSEVDKGSTFTFNIPYIKN